MCYEPQQDIARTKACGCAVILAVKLLNIAVVQRAVFESNGTKMAILNSKIAQYHKSGTREGIVTICFRAVLGVLDHNNRVTVWTKKRNF
jgi:hypothetical protein